MAQSSAQVCNEHLGLNPVTTLFTGESRKKRSPTTMDDSNGVAGRSQSADLPGGTGSR